MIALLGASICIIPEGSLASGPASLLSGLGEQSNIQPLRLPARDQIWLEAYTRAPHGFHVWDMCLSLILVTAKHSLCAQYLSLRDKGSYLRESLHCSFRGEVKCPLVLVL